MNLSGPSRHAYRVRPPNHKGVAMSREPRISELTGADVGRYITICRGKTLNDGKRELVLRGMLEAVTHSGGVAHVHVSFDGGHFVYRDDRDGKVTVEDGDLGDIYWSDDS